MISASSRDRRAADRSMNRMTKRGSSALRHSLSRKAVSKAATDCASSGKAKSGRVISMTGRRSPSSVGA